MGKHLCLWNTHHDQMQLTKRNKNRTYATVVKRELEYKKGDEFKKGEFLEVAVKHYKENIRIRSIVREIDALRKLQDCPYVPRLYGITRPELQTSLWCSIVMESCYGDLGQPKVQKDIGAQIIKIFAETASAVRKMHEKGLVHRDIKPANIMVVNKREEEWEARLIDFGIARNYSDEGDMTHNAGTGSFKAPETRNGTFDAKSDIYSFGKTMQEMERTKANILFTKQASAREKDSPLRHWKKIAFQCSMPDRDKRPQLMDTIYEILTSMSSDIYLYSR